MDAVILEMEEKTHDEGEESWQLALKHPRWQENEASDFLTKPVKTRKVKAPAGDDLKLIKGAKGMHFPSGQWNDAKTIAEANKRVCLHKMDVATFFKDENNRKQYKANFGLISADVPYGDQKDPSIDPPWDDDTITSIVEGIWHMVAEKGTVVIQCGGCDAAAQWRKAFRAHGFTLENEPRNVCPTRSDSSIKYHANPGRYRAVVSTSHYWVVVFKGMSSLSEIKGAAPFGVFDQYSFLNATTLTGCPMTRPRNRLLNKDGKYVRYFEKDVRESMEILSRSFFHFSLFSFCFTTCYQN